MAANLMKAGFELTAFDVRAEARDEPALAAASWAASPGELAAGSEVVITSLPGPPQVAEVVLGSGAVLERMPAGGLYIDLSTSTPDSIREIAAAAATRGIAVIDSPVAGGVRGARNGTLTLMVGASDEAFQRARPVLAGIGTQIFHVGDVGAGHVAKLVNNMMSIVNGLVAMEAMVVGAKGGVDVSRLLEVVEAGTGGSFALNVIRYVVFKGAFDPAKFALDLAAKDLRLSVEFAEQLGVPISIVEGASAALAAAQGRGLGDRDWSSYITLMEGAAGVEVRAP
jgi:3-hydroxyisobutyrate dehydrogenase